jgi:hypothetical protein
MREKLSIKQSLAVDQIARWRFAAVQRGDAGRSEEGCTRFQPEQNAARRLQLADVLGDRMVIAKRSFQ